MQVIPKDEDRYIHDKKYREAYDKVEEHYKSILSNRPKIWKVCTKCDAVFSPEFYVKKCSCGGSIDYMETLEW